MSRGGAPAIADQSALSLLLKEPRYEVIPVQGIEQKVAALPYGATVTITASPKLGIDRTLDVSTALAARGFHVVPHLAARMVAGRGHLERLVQRLEASRIHEVFVIGGDADPPAGGYADAGDLLEELAGLAHPFVRVGIGGYPEGHPLIADDRLLEALRRKQPFASHVVTQLCFDAGALAEWTRDLRAAGVTLPVVVGLPGVVERRKLAEISLKTGVGASLRYLRKHGRQLVTLARSRRYDPTSLAEAVAGYADDPALGIGGVHLFTFNQVEQTRDWVARNARVLSPPA
jgi:methylenetetrahydrofolate reductase (NADPH)